MCKLSNVYFKTFISKKIKYLFMKISLQPFPPRSTALRCPSSSLLSLNHTQKSSTFAFTSASREASPPPQPRLFLSPARSLTSAWSSSTCRDVNMDNHLTVVEPHAATFFFFFLTEREAWYRKRERLGIRDYLVPISPKKLFPSSKFYLPLLI